MKSKRPWAKYAKIVRVELNNGDVKYRAISVLSNHKGIDHFGELDTETAQFEDLASAEAHLDDWWETKWKPWDGAQIKHTRRA